jgi:hypothetical protein
MAYKSETASTTSANTGLKRAQEVRATLGEDSTEFDSRLIGDLASATFDFLPTEHDIVVGELQGAGISKLASKTLAFEILALAKYYDKKYDEFLPLIDVNGLDLTDEIISTLNTTRASNNQLGRQSVLINEHVSRQVID